MAIRPTHFASFDFFSRFDLHVQEEVHQSPDKLGGFGLGNFVQEWTSVLDQT